MWNNGKTVSNYQTAAAILIQLLMLASNAEAWILSSARRTVQMDSPYVSYYSLLTVRYHPRRVTQKIQHKVMPRSFANYIDNESFWASPLYLFSGSNDSNDEKNDNDGLEDDDNDDDMTMAYQTSDELKILQQKPSSIKSSAEEPDLFVPIFALVALIGFFGVYAFETLRLYSRGELWNN